MTVGTTRPGLATTSVPKPESGVIESAHNLLALMGDPKQTKKPKEMLAKMLEAQRANEATFQQARAAIVKLETRAISAKEAERDATAERQKLADETAKASKLLGKRSAELDTEDERLKTWAVELEARDDTIAQRESALRRAFNAIWASCSRVVPSVVDPSGKHADILLPE